MIGASCPSCQSEVHPLLGPAPLVRGNRVVMCCSEACREMVLDGLVAQGPPPVAQTPGLDLSAAASEIETLVRDGEHVSDLPEAAGPLPASQPTRESAAADSPRVSDVAVEAPAPPETRQRRVVMATVMGGGGLLLLFAGYLILSHSYGPGSGRASLSATLGGSRAVGATQPEGVRPTPRPEAKPSQTAPRPPPKRPSLMTLKKQSWIVLEGFLASRTGRFWRTAARVLAEQGHSGALAALRKALQSDKWANRQRAAEALAKLGHSEGVDVLKKDLAARRRPVKWASAFALARCGDSAGLRIIKQLANYRQTRMTAYEALVRLGDKKGMVHLRKVFATSRAPYDRLRAAVALGMRGDRSGLALLKARLKEPGMHIGVALALQKLGAPEARPALLRALDHTALREEAARALKAYGDVTLVSKMASELKSDSEDSRLTAAAAIVILTAQARAEAR